MAISGFFKQVFTANAPRRGNSSNDWSDPNDFKGDDTVRYYVDSAAADDTGNGLSAGTAKKTIAAGMALLRAGQISVMFRPDQLLLKRGGTWTDETFDYLTTDNLYGGNPICGRSATQRVVIGTYGTGERPHVKTGSLQRALTSGPNSVNNIAILGIDFDSYKYPESGVAVSGIEWSGPGTHVLIEDCLFRRNAYGIFFLPPGGLSVQTNFTIRRNVFLTNDFGNWIRLGRAENMLIEENHFDGFDVLGWSTTTVRGGIQGDADCLSLNIIVQGNTFSNFGSHAIYLPCGATVRDNVFFAGGHGIQVGNHYEGFNPGFNARAGGVEVNVIGNYISDLKDLPGSVTTTPLVCGVGIKVENSLPDGAVRDNILARNTGTRPYAIYVEGSGDTAAGVPCPVRDLTVQGNKVYKWWRANNPLHYKGIQFSGNNNVGQPQELSNIDFKDNDFQEPLGTTSLLVHVFNFASRTEIHSARNRFWRIGLADDRYNYGTGGQDLTMYQTWMSDTTSLETLVAYPDPDKTIGDYHGTIGGTATQAAYVAAIRAQSRFTTGGASGWNDDLMAEKVLAYMRGNFAA